MEKMLGPQWKAQSYVLAVSGGLDSMVLLELFSEAVDPGCLLVAHVNYQLRKSAIRDEITVCQTAQDRGIASVVFRPNVEKDDENSLRQLRFDFLQSLPLSSTIIPSTNAPWVVTAHHGRDQLETWLMRLLRGTQVDGLKGMEPKQERRLKPLLGVGRDSIEAFAQERGLVFGEDETNDSSRYLRNRVRQEVVLPFEKLMPLHGGKERFYERLASLSQTLAEQEKMRLDFAHRWAERHVSKTPFWWSFSLGAWSALTLEQQQNLLIYFMDQLGVQLLQSQRVHWQRQMESGRRRFSVGEGIEGRVSCERLFISTLEMRRNSPPSWRAVGQGLWEAGPSRVQLEDNELIVRYRHDGDIFRGKKLKEWLLAARVPAPERSLIPVVAAPGRPPRKAGDQDFARDL